MQTQLSYMGARYYDPLLGRFMGVDPQEIQPDNLNGFNRYAYANNNPYKYVDPDGRTALDLVFLAYDIGKLSVAIYKGQSVGLALLGDLAADVVGVASPIPGAGQAIKAARAAERGVEAVRSIRSAGRIAEAEKGASEVGYVAKGGTYKLKDADGVVKRTGKNNDLDRRRSEHARNSETKDLDFEVDRRTDCCNAQRGREQIIYDQHPEAQAVNGGLNKRRPVSPNNPNRDIYRAAGGNL